MPLPSLIRPSLIRIGTRNSRLALAQAEMARDALLGAYPAHTFTLVPMLTSGDRNAGKSLAEIGGKGLFTKELEDALLKDGIDIAVHSLKDMETHLPAGLAIGAVLMRADPRDALITRAGHTLATLPPHARIGTSSPRRAAQILIARPDLTIVPFRGNVTTRLAKLKAGEADATLLALAGLHRLGLESEASEIMDTVHFIPAAGQGTIAMECREEDGDIRQMLAAIRHQPTHYAMLAERGALAAIGGSCRTPIGAYAEVSGETLTLRAMLAKPEGGAHACVMREGNVGDAQALGESAGKELLARAGKDWF